MFKAIKSFTWISADFFIYISLKINNMATYKYDLVGGKIRVQKGSEARNFFPFHELVRIVEAPTYVGVVFVNSSYSFNINPATDIVILSGTTISAGSQTVTQLADTLSSSTVFQKANSGGGGPVSLTSLTDAATIQWDLADKGYRSKVSITVNRLLNITNQSVGQVGILEVTHTNANTQITLPGVLDANFRWGSVAGDVTVLNFFYDGSVFRWSSSVYGTPVTPTPIASLQDLVIASSTGVTKTGTVYTPTTPSGTNWGNTILWTKKLASGVNGYLQLDVDTTAAGSGFGMLGFKTTAVQGGYTTFQAAIWLDGNGISFYDNGAIDAVYVLSVGMKVRIIRTGSVIKAQTSNDNGSTWVDRKTYTFASSADLYPVTDIRGDGRLVNPKGYALT